MAADLDMRSVERVCQVVALRYPDLVYKRRYLSETLDRKRLYALELPLHG